MSNPLILNYNLPITGLPDIGDYGRIEFTETLDDFPALTVVRYSKIKPSIEIGNSITVGPYTLILESYSIEEPSAILDKSPLDKVFTITENYVHPSKFILNTEINIKKFFESSEFLNIQSLNNNKDYPDFILVNASSLVNYANTLATVNADVSLKGDFKVKLPKKPSDQDVIVLADLLDHYCLLYNSTYTFSQNTLSFSPLGEKNFETSFKPLNNIVMNEGILPCYKNNLLTWDFEVEQYLANKNLQTTSNNNLLNGEEDNEESGYTIPEGPKYVEIDNKDTILYEGDFNPGSPPDYSSSGKPRDISVMFDISGPTKSFKITQFKWGAPYAAIEGTFGYAHAALELVDDPNKPYDNKAYCELLTTLENIQSGNLGKVVFPNVDSYLLGYPDDINLANPLVWRLIKIVKTTYKYSPIKFKPTIKVKTKDGKVIDTKITDQDLLDKATACNLEVLVGEVSVGWELKRFATEDPTNFTEGSIAAWLQLNQLESIKDTLLGQNPTPEELQNYNYARYSSKVKLESYLYRKVPYKAVTYYKIEPYSKYYKDVDKINWHVEFIPKNKDAAKKPEWDANNPDNLIAIVYPDPNWVPALMLTGEVYCSSSIATQGNPDWNPWARTYYEMNPAIITTGSEEYRHTTYKILPSKNTVLNKDYSANIKTIVDQALNQAKNFSNGTYYTPHAYMTVDSGSIKTLSIPNVDVNFNTESLASKSSAEDRYVITTVQRTSGESFTSKLRTVTTSVQTGRPPSATVRKPQYEEIPVESGLDPSKENEKYKDNELTEELNFDTESDKLYIINSNSVNGFNRLNDQNFNYCFCLNDALTCARSVLIKQALNTTTFNLNYPFTEVNFSSKVNSLISIGGVSWIIKSASISIEIYQGKPLPQYLNLEVGLFYKDAEITVNIVNVEKEKDEEDSDQNVIIPEPEGAAVSAGNVPIELEDLTLDIKSLDIPSEYTRWIK